MAKLTRVTGKVFGSAATATVRGIGQFGSAAAGTPNLTTDVATIQALPASILPGWQFLDYGDRKAVCIGAKDARNSAETILTGQNGILRLNGQQMGFRFKAAALDR